MGGSIVSELKENKNDSAFVYSYCDPAFNLSKFYPNKSLLQRSTQCAHDESNKSVEDEEGTFTG